MRKRLHDILIRVARFVYPSGAAVSIVGPIINEPPVTDEDTKPYVDPETAQVIRALRNGQRSRPPRWKNGH
jgi:hypothetical protein